MLTIDRDLLTTTACVPTRFTILPTRRVQTQLIDRIRLFFCFVGRFRRSSDRKIGAAETAVPQQLRPVVQPPRHVAPAPQVRVRRTASVQVRVLSENVCPEGQPQQAPDGRSQEHFGRDERVLRRAVRKITFREYKNKYILISPCDFRARKSVTTIVNYYRHDIFFFKT